MPVNYVPHPIKADYSLETLVAGIWYTNNTLRPIMLTNDVQCHIPVVAAWAWFSTNIRENVLAPISITSSGGWTNPPQGAAPLTAYHTAFVMVPAGWQYRMFVFTGVGGIVTFGQFERWDL